jgi:hypothetical protein
MSSKANAPEIRWWVLELEREIYFGEGQRSNSLKTLGSYGDELTNEDLSWCNWGEAGRRNAANTAGMTADAEKDVLSSQVSSKSGRPFPLKMIQTRNGAIRAVKVSVMYPQLHWTVSWEEEAEFFPDTFFLGCWNFNDIWTLRKDTVCVHRGGISGIQANF